MPLSTERGRRNTRTPQRLGASPPTTRPTPSQESSIKTPKTASRTTARPKYFSDGDTRPVYRGTFYAVIRDTGLAAALLSVYFCFAIWDCAQARNLPRLLCRLAHLVSLRLNVVLSDDLHNLDKHMGPAYRKPSTTAVEQKLHAKDWRAAIAVPATYHMLLIFGITQYDRIQTADVALLATNLLAFLVMCWRIAPERITPKRELFLSFVCTFGAQMVLLLLAFYRARSHHPTWFPLWFIYAFGLIAKGLEFPTNDTFGHHEVLHASCIMGHAAGLLNDVLTT